jgi:hypothetical protein
LSRVLAQRALIAHGDHGWASHALSVQVSWIGKTVLQIDYAVTGPTDALLWPNTTVPQRTNGLWQATCFEAFIGLGRGYVEYNFSPSRQWASYVFDSYREGMRDALELPDPAIEIAPIGSDRFAMTVVLDISALPDAQLMGLSAVLEHQGGNKSYWALKHPPGKADFHHPDCFALHLAAGEGA